MYPIIALIVAMLASCGEMTSLRMRRSRNKVQMNRIIERRPNTCRYTYVFRMPDGGCHDL
jgi:hypothetical protein